MKIIVCLIMLSAVGARADGMPTSGPVAPLTRCVEQVSRGIDELENMPPSRRPAATESAALLRLKRKLAADKAELADFRPAPEKPMPLDQAVAVPPWCSAGATTADVFDAYPSFVKAKLRFTDPVQSAAVFWFARQAFLTGSSEPCAQLRDGRNDLGEVPCRDGDRMLTLAKAAAERDGALASHLCAGKPKCPAFSRAISRGLSGRAICRALSLSRGDCSGILWIGWGTRQDCAQLNAKEANLCRQLVRYRAARLHGGAQACGDGYLCQILLGSNAPFDAQAPQLKAQICSSAARRMQTVRVERQNLEQSDLRRQQAKSRLLGRVLEDERAVQAQTQADIAAAAAGGLKVDSPQAKAQEVANELMACKQKVEQFQPKSYRSYQVVREALAAQETRLRPLARRYGQKGSPQPPGR